MPNKPKPDYSSYTSIAPYSVLNPIMQELEGKFTSQLIYEIMQTIGCSEGNRDNFYKDLFSCSIEYLVKERFSSPTNGSINESVKDLLHNVNGLVEKINGIDLNTKSKILFNLKNSLQNHTIFESIKDQKSADIYEYTIELLENLADAIANVADVPLEKESGPQKDNIKNYIATLTLIAKKYKNSAPLKITPIPLDDILEGNLAEYIKLILSCIIGYGYTSKLSNLNISKTAKIYID